MATQNVGSDCPEDGDDLRGAIDAGALAHGGHHPERKGDGQRHAHCERRKLERVRQSCLQQLDHRAARADRVAEISGRRAADEREVLLHVRAVEPQVLAGVGVVLLARVHRQDHVQGIAGGAREDEDDNGQERQGNERLHEPKGDEAQHVAC